MENASNEDLVCLKTRMPAENGGTKKRMQIAGRVNHLQSAVKRLSESTSGTAVQTMRLDRPSYIKKICLNLVNSGNHEQF
jgi:hypothetical protein